MSRAGKTESSQKTSDSLGNLHVEETNVDGAPGLLSNEFLAFDIRFNSGKMNVGFDGQDGHDGHVDFDSQYSHNSHDGFNGQ